MEENNECDNYLCKTIVEDPIDNQTRNESERILTSILKRVHSDAEYIHFNELNVRYKKYSTKKAYQLKRIIDKHLPDKIRLLILLTLYRKCDNFNLLPFII